MLCGALGFVGVVCVYVEYSGFYSLHYSVYQVEVSMVLSGVVGAMWSFGF